MYHSRAGEVMSPAYPASFSSTPSITTTGFQDRSLAFKQPEQIDNQARSSSLETRREQNQSQSKTLSTPAPTHKPNASNHETLPLRQPTRKEKRETSPSSCSHSTKQDQNDQPSNPTPKSNSKSNSNSNPQVQTSLLDRPSPPHLSKRRKNKEAPPVATLFFSLKSRPEFFHLSI